MFSSDMSRVKILMCQFACSSIERQQKERLFFFDGASASVAYRMTKFTLNLVTGFLFWPQVLSSFFLLFPNASFSVCLFISGNKS